MVKEVHLLWCYLVHPSEVCWAHFYFYVTLMILLVAYLQLYTDDDNN